MTPAASRLQEGNMQRTAVNPWKWSLDFGFNQAEIIEGGRRQLICSGQTPVDADGRPQHAGDMRAQVGLAMDNVEAVLAGADMTLADLVQFKIYTTDVDAFLGCFDVIAQRFGAAGVQPPSTLLGVTRLASPELMVELEATAVA
jgi:enamine deaminase RidA (YjgF/YER057c/UK114 family)